MSTTRSTHPLEGKRIRLIRTTDEYTDLKPGTEGTVTFVDSMGTVHVRWSTGSTLGLIEAAGDRYEVIA